MSDITIPAAVVEAAARAACRTVEKAHGSMETWNYLGYESVEAFIDAAWPNYVDQTRAACLAMLETWPGMRISTLFPPNGPHVVLPLPTEASDE